MPNDTIRWIVSVSRDTDIAVRSFLARRGMKKGDLSKFIEDAVKWGAWAGSIRRTAPIRPRHGPRSLALPYACLDTASPPPPYTAASGSFTPPGPRPTRGLRRSAKVRAAARTALE